VGYQVKAFEKHRFRPTYPDFLHGAPPTSACAAFIKESRMNLANARKLDRKSGVRWCERGAPVMALAPARSPKSAYWGQRYAGSTAVVYGAPLVLSLVKFPILRFCCHFRRALTMRRARCAQLFSWFWLRTTTTRPEAVHRFTMCVCAHSPQSQKSLLGKGLIANAPSSGGNSSLACASNSSNSSLPSRR
jgi:hypothetical protein